MTNLVSQVVILNLYLFGIWCIWHPKTRGVPNFWHRPMPISFPAAQKYTKIMAQNHGTRFRRPHCMLCSRYQVREATMMTLKILITSFGASSMLVTFPCFYRLSYWSSEARLDGLFHGLNSHSGTRRSHCFDCLCGSTVQALSVDDYRGLCYPMHGGLSYSIVGILDTMIPDSPCCLNPSLNSRYGDVYIGADRGAMICPGVNDGSTQPL